MRPAPPPPLYNDVPEVDHVISSSSSEDESSDVVGEIPLTKMITSLPNEDMTPQHLKRFNTEVVNYLIQCFTYNLTLTLSLYLLVDCDVQTEQSEGRY